MARLRPGPQRLRRPLGRRGSNASSTREDTSRTTSHAAISMAAVYTDAVHIADGVVGRKQRSLAASDPTA